MLWVWVWGVGGCIICSPCLIRTTKIMCSYCMSVPPLPLYTQELEHQHGAVLALGFVGKHALLQSTERARQAEAEDQTDAVELQSKRPRAGDITLDVLTKLGKQ